MEFQAELRITGASAIPNVRSLGPLSLRLAAQPSDLAIHHLGKTEALWYVGESKFEMRPVEIPEPGYDEVIVEREACGICTWDLVAYLGRFGRYQSSPFCAGHEGVGRVIRVGPRVPAVRIGRRVVMHEFPVGTPGGPQTARHALRAERRVSVIPDGPIPVHYWIIEPAACIVNGAVHAWIQPGDRVTLVGTGCMGPLFVQALMRTLAGTTALSLARPGAIIETFAWYLHEHTFDLEDWHVNGWRILNAQPGMNPHFGDLFPRTVSLMAAGAISTARLVTHTGPVGRASEVFRAGAAKSGGYIKGVITF
jgi:threonine dehydrogenase-like Zn-dependent dehydrogenase